MGQEGRDRCHERRSRPNGKLLYRQTIFEDIESCVDAMNGLFTGAIGKMLVRSANPQL